MYFITVLVFAACASANEPVQGREFHAGGGAEELLNMTKTPAALQQPQQAKMKLNFSCTNGSGRTFNKGEQGYYECMEQYQQSKKFPGPGRAPNQATGFNINVD